MSLLELIAGRSRTDRAAFSQPDLLAERALPQLPDRTTGHVNDPMTGQIAAELLRNSRQRAHRHAETLLDHGVRENAFLEGYAAGAAALLDNVWEEARLSFAIFIHSMDQLMEVVRSWLSAPPAQPFLEIDRPQVLMARAPGEEHALGLPIAVRNMRRRGWLVRLRPSGELKALAAATPLQPFGLIGFTASSRVLCQSLRATNRRFQPDSATVVGRGISDGDDLAGESEADLALGRRDDPLERLVEHFRVSAG